MPKRMTPESYVKAAVCEYLTLRKVFFLRINSGSMFGEHQGKKWRVAMAEPGTADLLVLDTLKLKHATHTLVLWLELKAPNGKQSPAQKEFQKRVEAEGHRYAIVRSIEDVQSLGL